MAGWRGLGQQTPLSPLSLVISTHPKALSVIQVSVNVASLETFLNSHL